MIEVYSRNECPSCQKLKQQLNVMGIVYNEKIIDEDVSRDDFKDTFPMVNVLPVLIVDGAVYSGYDKAVEILNEYKSDLGKDLLLEKNDPTS